MQGTNNNNSDQLHDELVLKEMIRIILSHLTTRPHQSHATKTEILALLYEVKHYLPDTNPYKRLLAYYWYKDGPYSEQVYRTLDAMRSGGRVLRNTTGMYVHYKMVPYYRHKPFIPYETGDAHMNEIRKIIDAVLNKFIDISDLLKIIYKRDAPYKWYYTYGRDVVHDLSCHFQAILDERPYRYIKDETIELLNTAVRDYPADAEFTVHRHIFMNFVCLARISLVENREQKPDIEFVQLLIVKMWDVFALNIRIVHHDRYYNDHVDEWRQTHEKASQELGDEIYEYLENVVNNSNYKMIIDLIRKADMEQAANQLVRLEDMTKEDPDKESIDLKSLRRFAVFLLGRHLPIPDIGIGPSGLVEAVWRPSGGILSMDFMPDGNVMFASVFRQESGRTDWDADGTMKPDKMLSIINPVVKMLNQ